ncbi:MAG: M28 family peptidase [Acidobacteriota bacterium]|nr:M28 family peptidase [Acidobacteriota bacterium]
MPRILCSAIFLLIACWFHHLAFAQSIQDLDSVAKAKIQTDLSFRGGAFKSEKGRKAAQFIADLLQQFGLKPIAGSKDFFQPIDGGGQNVISVLEGKERKHEFVVVSAHYDALGEQFAGAMDNAAGVAVMLELARLLAKNPPQRSLLFIAFDGGEQNNAGAKFYTDHPLGPLDKTVAAINLSGFGGGFGEQLYESLYVIGAEYSPQLAQAVTKYKRSEAYLALLGEDATHFLGGEHFHFKLKQVPAITITNGVHYAYHSKADTANRINFPALEKHVATLAKVIAEIANTPNKIERTPAPSYDADEVIEWIRLLTALRENVIKTAANNAGQAKIDDALLELKRFKGVAMQDPKAREAVILRAASIVFYIANPNGVEFNSLLDAARGYEQSGNRKQAIAAYQKLLKFIEDEYRRDDQTVKDIHQRLDKLMGRQ